MNTPTNTLALIIDGDNVPLQYTKQLIQFCERRGTPIIMKVYGDWKQPPLSSHCQTLTELGVHCVQVNRVGKNATDRGLASDVDLMLEQGEANVYFIVSGDGHFAPMCERIRQKGAKVIVVGRRSNTSGKLRKFCNRYYYVDEIVGKQIQASTKSAAPIPKITTM